MQKKSFTSPAMILMAVIVVMATLIPAVSAGTSSAPVITTPSLAAGTVGLPYSQTLSASGGTPPYSWSVSSGKLPSGITLSPSGILSGKPTLGTYVSGIPYPLSVELKVTDRNGASTKKVFSITISNAITTSKLKQLASVL